MTHRHAHHTVAFWTLTLPDADGWADHFIAWYCPCGDNVWATGYFSPQTCAMAPEVWEQQRQREHYAQNPIGQEARRQERVHVPMTRTKYETSYKAKRRESVR